MGTGYVVSTPTIVIVTARLGELGGASFGQDQAGKYRIRLIALPLQATSANRMPHP
jgi:hypothetical protein